MRKHENVLRLHPGKLKWHFVRYLTDDLRRRVEEHKRRPVDSFTKNYKISRLMYFEIFRDAEAAAKREIQIKKFRREKKIALFAKANPHWEDLSKRFPRSYKDILM